MTADVRVDTRSFGDALDQFIALKRVTLRDGLRQQAGLLADELVRDTPPTKGVVSGKPYAARQAGEARLARDVRRAARPLNPARWKSPRLAELIREKQYGPLQAAFSHFSPTRIVAFRPAVHQTARDAEGRVRKAQPQATPDHLEEAAYARRQRRRVGLAKGGWVASLLGLGRRVPAWLRPHAWVGDFEDRSETSEPSVRLINGSNWAGGQLAEVIVGRAVTRREGRLRRWIEGALAANARKAGLA